MLTSSDVDPPEAYVPEHPGPEVERYWLPSTRATAIEWARQARLVGTSGLAVDAATLERVADAIMDPAHPPPWARYTAEEREDDLPAGLWGAIQGYLAAHPEVDGRVDADWRDGRRVFIVAIAGDPQRHRARLERLGGSRVIVERRKARPPRNEAEMQEIAARISADTARLAAAGLCVERMESVCDDVEVHVTGGRDERAATSFFAARYGEAVFVRWLGPNRFLRPLRPFGSWTSDGRRLRVFFGLDPNGEEPFGARVAEETDERIVLALSSLEPARIVQTLIGGFHRRHTDVMLREPVGTRTVIDASAGVPRPSLAELGLDRAATRADASKRAAHGKGAPDRVQRRRAQIWFAPSDEDDTVYEAMLPVAPRLDAHGDPVVSPAVRREVLDAIRRAIVDRGRGFRMWWVGDALMVQEHAEGLHAFAPGPDGLYEIERLASWHGPSQWQEVDPPVPDGPIDADTAVDLLSRARKRHPAFGIILRRLDLDVLRAARARVADESIRDAVDDEIAERTHGTGARMFQYFLRKLERGTSEDRGYDAHYLEGLLVHTGRDDVLGLVPDAGERVFALTRAERDPDPRRSLEKALRRLGREPPPRT